MRNAFTLIEIMIVIIILGLLSSLVVPNLIGQSDQAKEKIVCIQMESLNNALKTFRLENGCYPSTKEGLLALIKNPDPTKYTSFPKGGFLDKGLPRDPWKNDYIYINEDDNVELISLGADRKEGGTDINRDIEYSSCQKR